MTDFKYDVAFSFVARDESIAVALADRLTENSSVFVYSRKQEELAGTNGEVSFGKVFGVESRLVVVLHRDSWGTTPWTRIEETAIRNRAYDEGYDFVLLIPVQEPPSPPKWFPRTQLWIGLAQHGLDTAAAIIEARIQQLGGEPRALTLEDRASIFERKAVFERTRRQYLQSENGVQAANAAFDALCDAIVASIPGLNQKAPSLQIAERRVQGKLALLSSQPSLLVAWRLKYANSLADAELEASFWRGPPPFPGLTNNFDESRRLQEIQLLPDLSLSGDAVWRATHSGGVTVMEPIAAAQFILDGWLRIVAGELS